MHAYHVTNCSWAALLPNGHRAGKHRVGGTITRGGSVAAECTRGVSYSLRGLLLLLNKPVKWPSTICFFAGQGGGGGEPRLADVWLRLCVWIWTQV
jgi:hypothetical protein